MPAPRGRRPREQARGQSPERCTESRTLESKAFRDFIERLRNNTLECDAGGKVLRLKRFISSTAGPKVLNEVLEALKHNTKVEALYIQNFEEGFYDEQLEKLTEVLKLKRIWCLNVGENFRTTLPAWRAFAKELPETAVSHMYASEHHFIGTDVKNQMKDAIRGAKSQRRPALPRGHHRVREHVVQPEAPEVGARHEGRHRGHLARSDRPASSGLVRVRRHRRLPGFDRDEERRRPRRRRRSSPREARLGRVEGHRVLPPRQAEPVPGRQAHGRADAARRRAREARGG